MDERQPSVTWDITVEGETWAEIQAETHREFLRFFGREPELGDLHYDLDVEMVITCDGLYNPVTIRREYTAAVHYEVGP
jgi:hypothetical protein